MVDMSIEIWRRYYHNGVETYCEGSNYGRLRTIKREFVNHGLKYGSRIVKEAKMLNPAIGNKGYKRVSLIVDGISYKPTVHKIIASLFIENPNKLDFDQINHKDTDKTNNRADNLVFCNNSINIQHAYDNGLIRLRKGKDNPASRETLRLKDGVVIKRYDCVADAEKDGFKVGSIYGAIRRNYKHKGFEWKYID